MKIMFLIDLECLYSFSLHHMHIHLRIWNGNPIGIKGFFYLFIQAPFDIPVFVCRHPDAEPHDHRTVGKLIYKNNHFLVGFGSRVFLQNMLQKLLRFLNIGIIRDSHFNFQFPKITGSYIDDGAVRQFPVRNDHMLIINSGESRIKHLNFIHSTFCTFYLVLDNIISYLKRLEQKQHHAASQILQTALQGKTNGNTGRSQKCCHRRFLHTEICCNIKYQNQIEKKSSKRTDKLGYTFVYTCLFHGAPGKLQKTLNQLGSHIKGYNRKNHFHSEADQIRNMTVKVSLDLIPVGAYFIHCFLDSLLNCILYNLSFQIPISFFQSFPVNNSVSCYPKTISSCFPPEIHFGNKLSTVYCKTLHSINCAARINGTPRRNFHFLVL